jgi:hypothetical protein
LKLEPVVRPPRPPTNWGELASNLGVKVLEEPVEAIVAEQVPDKAVPDKASFAESDVDSRQAVAPDEPADAPPLLVEETVESTALVTVERPDEPALLEAESVAAGGDVESLDSDAGAFDGKSGRRRRRRRRRPRGAGADVPIETPEELSKAAFGDGLFDLMDAAPAAVEASGGEPKTEQIASGEETAPGRTKRRRRRGSGRKKAAAEKGIESREVEPDDDGPGSVDEAADAARKPTAVPPGDEGQRFDEKKDDDGDDDEDESGKGSKMSHRGIPTWAEAIDFIISTNMENRAKRPGGGSGRSRGGRKRGGRPKSSEKAS